jgi:hypothetical protein
VLAAELEQIESFGALRGRSFNRFMHLSLAAEAVRLGVLIVLSQGDTKIG